MQGGDGEAAEQVEHTLYVCREVKVYRIPPRPAAGGHSSGTWLVDDCIFTGRLRMVARRHAADIRLEDAASGELFAVCPFTPATAAVAVEPAADSSRCVRSGCVGVRARWAALGGPACGRFGGSPAHASGALHALRRHAAQHANTPAHTRRRNFVLRVEDPASRRHAFLGLAFSERGHSFDFNAAIVSCCSDGWCTQGHVESAWVAACVHGGACRLCPMSLAL
jgi:hypothetical protein